MRPQAIIGIVLILLGAFVLFRGISYPSREEVLKVGDVEASVESKKAVPAWAGGVALVAGIVLVAAG
ncbi:MAG TPA: hypothetical protein VFO71_02115, partial [Gemmatimonadales bacterium]|nr:hypothetical protein [Gemmatimonadales bacterium]